MRKSFYKKSETVNRESFKIWNGVKGFFVTGTDTGVGKTEVLSYLARRFSQKGFKVGVMKPVATGVKKISKDAEILKKSTFSELPFSYINPISLKLPLAPLVASRIEKRKINMNIVWDIFKRLCRSHEILLVEGIGGIMVPLYEINGNTYYVLDMIRRMKLPAIIVARPNLGTINHTLMTVKMLKNKNIKIKGIILNHSSRIKNDLSIKTNPRIIEELSGEKVLGIMYYGKDRNKRRMRWLHRLEF